LADEDAPGTDPGDQHLLRQSEILARFAELSLSSTDLDDILTKACQLVAEALGTGLAKVLQLQPDGRTLFVRAGVGWKHGVVGHTTLRSGEVGSEIYAADNTEPIISTDVDTETRFQYPSFLRENGVRAFVNVPITGGKNKLPFGIFQVDSRTPREFTEAETQFLRGYASLLAGSVARLNAISELTANNAELAGQVEKLKRAMEHQSFLSKEVDHRAKNMLAVIQAVVRLTKADDMRSFVKAVEGRISALGRAQTLLSADRWVGADLHTLIRGELSQFLQTDQEGPLVQVEGLPLVLPPMVTQPFSMALHELATNAVKYGALSNPAGRVRISWQVERRDRTCLVFRWAESGGPMVGGPPARRGFGLRVLTDTLRLQLGGTIFMAWNETGLVCDLNIPLAPATAVSQQS